MQHYMQLSVEPLAQIATGAKVIESRLYDEKRQQVALGDEIEFCANGNLGQKVKTRVKGLLRYPTFTETITKLFFAAKLRHFARAEDGRRTRTWLKYGKEDGRRRSVIWRDCGRKGSFVMVSQSYLRTMSHPFSAEKAENLSSFRFGNFILPRMRQNTASSGYGLRSLTP